MRIDYFHSNGCQHQRAVGSQRKDMCLQEVGRIHGLKRMSPKLSLSLIMAKLKETADSMIRMDIFILNMERLLRQKVLFLYAIFDPLYWTSGRFTQIQMNVLVLLVCSSERNCSACPKYIMYGIL